MKSIEKIKTIFIITLFLLTIATSVPIVIGNFQKLDYDNCEITFFHEINKITDYKLITYEGPTEEWSKTYGGSGFDSCYSLDITSDGGVILSGETSSYGAVNDIWLIKTDSSGNQEWYKTFGGEFEDWSNSVIETNDGGFILSSNTYVDDTRLYDGCIIKTDSVGNEEWIKYFGGTEWDLCDVIIQLSDGSYIIAGETYSFSDSGEAWLIKTDSYGNEIWNKTYGGIYEEWANSIQETSDGGVIIACTGYFGESRLYDGWLIKTDAEGNEEWNKYYGGDGFDFILDVKQNNNDGYILSGITRSFGSDFTSAWLLCLDSNGNEQWNQIIGESHYEYYGYSVDICNDGGYVMSAKSTHLSTGLSDLKVIKTDNLGNILWINTLGSIGYDYGFTIKQSSDDGYIISGQSDSYGDGSMDGWLVKISPFENERPNTPSTPTGPSTGKSKNEISYTSNSENPEGEDLYYMYDWGDDTINSWIGPFNSGETAIASHIWSETGTYSIKVKVKDIHNGESEWSDSLSISLSRSKSNKKVLFNEILKKLTDRFSFMNYLFEYRLMINIYEEIHGGRSK